MHCTLSTCTSIALLRSDNFRQKNKRLQTNPCLQLVFFMSHAFSNIRVNIFNNPSSFISPTRESEQQQLLKGLKQAFYHYLWHTHHINLLSNTCCCIYTLHAPWSFLLFFFFLTLEWAAVCVSMLLVIQTVKAKWGRNREAGRGYRVHVAVGRFSYTQPQHCCHFFNVSVHVHPFWPSTIVQNSVVSI